MSCLKAIRRWLFPLREKAEETSTKAIEGLEQALTDIREMREDSLRKQHRLFGLTMQHTPHDEKDDPNVIRAND